MMTAMVAPPPLVPLPLQPAGVPWPTEAWPTGSAPAAVGDLVDRAFTDPEVGTTYAVVVVQGGRLLVERYGGELEHWDRPNETVVADTPLLSWSMAKSMLHAVVGMLVAEGRLDLEAPAAVPTWSAPDDPRGAITLEHLLAMRDGLDFSEDYVDAGRSDVIEMLFGAGAADCAAFAADRPALAPPGERFNYSSGTSNIVSGIVARTVGPGGPYEALVRDRLLAPLGMTTATPRFDDAGSWIASSYVHATAHDFARFGTLYLRDGVWEDRRLLPEGWVDHARLERSVDEEGHRYGAHWWVAGDDHGTFSANGYEGQRISLSPALDLVLVRLGKTPAECYPALDRWRADLIAAVAAG
jgi:CubicO group peptidase (beta-lactamase class C family)